MLTCCAVWGISDNTRAYYDLSEGNAIGYQPTFFVIAGVVACAGVWAYFALKKDHAPTERYVRALREKLAVEHPDSFNVRFDSETWVQFMAQNQQFNMVILLGKAVPEPERPARFQAAKAAGDELFQCATSSVVGYSYSETGIKAKWILLKKR